MPIAVDGKKIELKDKECPYAKEISELKQKLYDEFGMFPLKLKWTGKYDRPDPDNPGRRIKKGGVGIPMYVVRYTKTGAEEWRFFEGIHRVKDTQVFTPQTKNFNGQDTITEGQFEYAIFLRYFSKLYGSYFEFENKAKEAKTRNQNRKLKAQVENLLLNESTIKNRDLDVLANQYKIIIPETVLPENRHEIIRDEILKRVEFEERKTGNGYENFMKLYPANDINEEKLKCAELIQYKIVERDDRAQFSQFVVVLPDGKKQVLGRRDKTILHDGDALYDVLKNDHDIRLDLYKKLDRKLKKEPAEHK